MIDYPLETGNNIERSISQLFKLHFPKYESFRSKYLLPLTGLPKDPNWRNDTHPELERIGIASFGILKSINFVYIKKNQIHVSGDPDQTFKNIYFHFGLAIDCVESLARSIATVESELQIININKKPKITKMTLIYSFVRWAIKEYPSSFLNMINEGKPISYYPQHDHNFLSIIVTKKSIRKKYQALLKQIKDYRNFFIHNPGVDVFMNNSSRKRYAIKKEMVKKSKNWATLRELYNIDKSLFIDPAEMVDHDLTNLLNEFNSIWNSISENLDLIYNHENFNILFRGYNRYVVRTK